MCDEPEGGHDPEDGIQHGENRRPADEDREVRQALPPHLAPELTGVAEVHEEGLQVALVPSRPLLHPVHEVAVRLLERDGVQHPHRVALAEHPDAQVGILRDIVGIPSSERPQHVASEVVGGPSQRDRRPHRRQTGKEEREPHGVLDGEPPGDQVLIGVVVRQLGLHASHIGPEPAQGHYSPSQLQRIRLVLGVVDGDELAPRQRQAEVEGLGLGPGIGRRDEHQGELRSGILLPNGIDRLVVVGLHQDEHLEAIHGVLQTSDARHQVIDHLRLVIGGDHHGVARKLRVRHCPRFLVGDSLGDVGARRAGEQVHAVAHTDCVDDGDDGDQRRDRIDGRDEQADCHQGDEPDEESPLPGGQQAPDRDAWGLECQSGDARLEAQLRFCVTHHQSAHPTRIAAHRVVNAGGTRINSSVIAMSNQSEGTLVLELADVVADLTHRQSELLGYLREFRAEYLGAPASVDGYGYQPPPPRFAPTPPADTRRAPCRTGTRPHAPAPAPPVHSTGGACRGSSHSRARGDSADPGPGRRGPGCARSRSCPAQCRAFCACSRASCADRYTVTAPASGFGGHAPGSWATHDEARLRLLRGARRPALPPAARTGNPGPGPPRRPVAAAPG